MSGQPFTFPPPPPPPPKRSTDGHDGFSRGGGYSHGTRGQFSGYRGRGRGNLTGRGRGRGTAHGYSQQHRSSHNSDDARPSRPIIAHREGQTGDHGTHQKRDHNVAFGADSQRRSRPQAAPAVPSFSASLASLLPSKPATAQPSRRESTKNALGLTPAAGGQSDSEDDEEEESRLAHTGGQDLQFEYRGQAANLRTPAEIAAWIAERKRRYPTQAKREAAQKEAEEKRTRWETEKQARLEATKLARENRQKGKRPDKSITTGKPAQKDAAKDEAATAAKLHAERLRRKALKAQRDLAAAEAKLEQYTGAAQQAEKDPALASSSDDSLGSLSDSSALSSDDPTDSDSDDDGPPEAQSSKIEVPSVSNEGGPGSRAGKRPCVSFSRTGRCRFGSRCHFSHEQAARPPAAAGQTKSKNERKSLFQALVEREQDEEHRKLLSAIIALGKQGALEPLAR